VTTPGPDQPRPDVSTEVRQAIQDERIGRMAQQLDELHTAVFSPRRPEDGLVIKVDRHGNTLAQIRRYTAVAGGAAVAAIVSAIVNWFSSGGGSGHTGGRTP